MLGRIAAGIGQQMLEMGIDWILGFMLHDGLRGRLQAKT